MLSVNAVGMSPIVPQPLIRQQTAVKFASSDPAPSTPSGGGLRKTIIGVLSALSLLVLGRVSNEFIDVKWKTNPAATATEEKKASTDPVSTVTTSVKGGSTVTTPVGGVPVTTGGYVPSSSGYLIDPSFLPDVIGSGGQYNFDQQSAAGSGYLQDPSILPNIYDK